MLGKSKSSLYFWPWMILSQTGASSTSSHGVSRIHSRHLPFSLTVDRLFTSQPLMSWVSPRRCAFLWDYLCVWCPKPDVDSSVGRMMRHLRFRSSMILSMISASSLLSKSKLLNGAGDFMARFASSATSASEKHSTSPNLCKGRLSSLITTILELKRRQGSSGFWFFWFFKRG